VKWNKLDKGIVVGLSAVLVAVVVLSFSDIAKFIDIPSQLTGFQIFALLVIIGYDMLPTLVQQFSISTFSTQLLQSGFSPTLFVIITAFALLGGQLILYVIGMFVRRIHKGSIGNLASHNHFLHKYHFLIYLIVPFVGILGDFVMLYSGHQRINPLKMIPFLLLGDFISASRWIYPAVLQLEVGRFLGA